MNPTIWAKNIPSRHDVDLNDETPNNTTVERILIRDDTMIVPCHARGVSDTHTPTNAYFEIPKGCKHGKILECSHYKCRQSGRRFRYCEVCKKVTAMRNFSKRHGHLIVHRNPTKYQSTMTSSPDSVRVSSNTKEPKQQPFVGSERDPLLKRSAQFMGVHQESSITATTKDSSLSTNSTCMPPSFVPKKAPNPLTPMMVSLREATLIEQIRSRPNGVEETISWILDHGNLGVRDKKRSKRDRDILPNDQSKQEGLQSPMVSSSIEFFDESDIDEIGLH
jgi:hypothetical protein